MVTLPQNVMEISWVVLHDATNADENNCFHCHCFSCVLCSVYHCSKDVGALSLSVRINLPEDNCLILCLPYRISITICWCLFPFLRWPQRSRPWWWSPGPPWWVTSHRETRSTSSAWSSPTMPPPGQTSTSSSRRWSDWGTTCKRHPCKIKPPPWNIWWAVSLALCPFCLIQMLRFFCFAYNAHWIITCPVCHFSVSFCL